MSFCQLHLFGIALGLGLLVPLSGYGVQTATTRDGSEPETAPQASHSGLPEGLLYPAYVAGEKEPRFAVLVAHSTDVGWKLAPSLGVRMPLWRYGTTDRDTPEGWQVDLEGAVFPRFDMKGGIPIESIDFRVGTLLAWRRGHTAAKVGYTHLSAHLGDEFILHNPGFERIEYVRDGLVGGVARSLSPEVVIYGEFEYAFLTKGGAEPWRAQFGAQYTPSRPNGRILGQPFGGVNLNVRQEFDFGASVNVIGGLEWETRASTRVIRWGLQYFNGKAMQYGFFDRDEEWAGTGIWIEF